MAKALNYNLNFTANTKQISADLKALQQQLEQITSRSFTIDNRDIIEAQQQARLLQQYLNFSTDKTGRLDLSKFNTELKKGQTSVTELSQSLLRLGNGGREAFAGLARSIATAQTPIVQTSKMMDELWTTIKNTMRWQFTTSALGTLTNAISDAVNYSHELDSIIRDIRIVSDESAEYMDQFAKNATKAAKALSSTTKDYLESSLIYFQQGKE